MTASVGDRGWLILALVLAFLLAMPPAGAAPLAVEEVRAEVTAAGELPPRVRQRMETTVATIAGQLLTGRRLDEVQATQARDAQVIHEVFDKVLVGYSVEQVTLQPGAVTQVSIRLVPWAEVIRAVEIEVSVEGMPPMVETLVRRDLAEVDTVFVESLCGLPVAASDWTNGGLKRSLNEYLEQHLPEFRGDFEVTPGPTARVALTVYPRLPVVRTVDLSMRSSSVPNFTLLNHRQRMEEDVHTLVGVPVEFVRRHQEDFIHSFAHTLDDVGDFHSLGMRTQVEFTHVGEQTAVLTRSDTDRFQIWLQGWADISRHGNKEDHDTIFRLHAGRWMTRWDELFLQADFAPQAMDCEWEVGYTRRLLPGTQLQVRYDVEARRFILGGEQRFLDRWHLRYEYRWSDQKGEAALGYRLHDFLSLEYVVDKDDKWFRVIGTF